MIPISIDEFSLEWIRDDQKQKLSATHPEGDAFQKICGNIFSDPVYGATEDVKLTLIPFPTKGRDGAIDHFAFTDKSETIIIECKKNKTTDNALNEIKDLKEGLLRNLASENALNTIYKPWFNVNLRQYIFCTSCIPENAAQVEKISESLGDMMQQIGALKSGLKHIQSIKPAIYFWPQLKAILERSAFLMYKWVKPGIEGIEYVSRQGVSEEGYRAYLSSDKIPYFSRDLFMKNHPEITDLPSEKKHLEDLVENPEKKYKGILIYGEGGIGKTRLMRELALKGHGKGWSAYKISSQINFNELLSFLRPGGKYLLLFDYIEELPEFHEWVEELTHSKRSFEVKIIANCRSSYISNVRVAASSAFLKLDISNTTESSRRFYQGVVGQIIKNIPALKHINNRIFRYRPSFAVFVRYMYDRDGQYDFDLRSNEDFGGWIIRRLNLSFSRPDGEKPDMEILTRLFACLPARGRGKEYLEDNYTSFINTLIRDGWFEKRSEAGDSEKKHLSVIHDTLADEVLTYYIEQNKGVIDVVVRKFFNFAASNSLLYGCSRAFERLLDHPLLAGIDFAAEFSRVIDRHSAEMTGFYYHLVKTSLFPDEKKIVLYFRHREFFDPFITSPEFAGPLSYMLNDFSKRKTEERLREQITSLYEWWYNKNKPAILENQNLSKIISTGIKFFGYRQVDQEVLKKYLINRALDIDTSFVIGSWLESGGDKETVKASLVSWLSEHQNLPEASFVIGPWVESGGDKETVKPFLVNWLGEHQNLPEARFVIGFWLKLGGDKETVKPFLVNWLGEHQNLAEASFVIGSWLESGGDKETVKPFLVGWLGEHQNLPEAQFVYSSWLESGGDKETVKASLVSWLSEHQNLAEASFVIGVWLKSGGDKATVKASLIVWLSEHQNLPEASFVIGSWLESGGDKETVKASLVSWFGEHQNLSEAQFVYSSWLKSGGDKETVKASLVSWLGEHQNLPEASFVIGSWLESGGDKETVKASLVSWLSEHQNLPEASFVIGSWLETGGDKETVKASLVSWLSEHQNLPKASFVIGSWLETGGDKETVEEFIDQWMGHYAADINASYIFQPWLKTGGKTVFIEKALATWLKEHSLKPNSFYTMGIWLQKGGNLDTVRMHIAEYLDKYTNDPKTERLLYTWMQAGGEVPIKIPESDV